MYVSQKQKIGLGIFGFLGLLLFINGLANLFGGHNEAIVHIIFGFIIVGGALWLIQRGNQDKQKFTESGGITSIPVGDYLIGLPSVNRGVEGVRCAIYPDYFAFMQGSRELDSIPRNSINQIIVDNKSQITQRLTATRIVALGVFALAAPKKQRHREFCLVIDWDDFSGVKQNTVFEFTGENAVDLANQAANTLKRYTKVKSERLKVSEKKCPFCAEVIKSEAKICRYCQSQVV